MPLIDKAGGLVKGLFRGRGSKNSYSFRKRRSQTRRRIALLGFAVALLTIVAAGVFLSQPNTVAKQGRAPLPTPEKISRTTSPSQTSSLQSLPLVPISPVLINTQKWNWPLNIYTPASFRRTWQYNDGPIQDGKVVRGWTYGPAPLASFLEQYKDTPQGLRLVQYWDKGRMEITDPSRPADASDYITQGKLVKEMLTGLAELGEGVNMPLGSAKIPVFGEISPDNPALTYAGLAPLASLKDNNRADKQLETTVTATLDKQNRPIKDPTLSRYGVKYVYYSQDSGHNIPSFFWDFLNRNGTVFREGQYVDGPVYDWARLAGQPISEAYWITALVNRKPTDVLIQAFERRILAYIPSNPPGSQVEWGNVGQHYLAWRYPGTELGSNKIISSATATPAPKIQSGPDDTPEVRVELGNEATARTIYIQNGRITHSTFVNRLTGRVYSNVEGLGTGGGFQLKLDGPDGKSGLVNGDQFRIVGYNMPVWNDSEKQIVLTAAATFQGETINVRLYWRAFAGRNYIEKWLAIDSSPALSGWKVRYASIEDLNLTDGLKAAPPTPDEETLPISIPAQRNPAIAGGAIFTHLMVHDNQGEGFYFFSASPLGGEYALNKRVVIFQEEYQDLKDGFTSGKAILGTYSGPVDIGFKRYTSYLENYYSKMAGKRQPIWYHSWYPFTNEITQDILLTQLDIMKQMNIYDLLHIDAGWESTYPLEIDQKKFPNGFKTLQDKAAEGNIRLGIWINPFSNSYEKYVSYAGMHRDHPEWHIKGMDRVDPKNGYATGPFAVNSDYYYYVRDKLVNLVKTYNIRAIYWDGADWNIPDASAPGLSDEQRNIVRVQGLKRMAALADELRAAVPDIIIIPWNSAADVHLLGAAEQLQLSDVWSLPLGESELFRHQQFFSATYQLPYYSIWGDWYSISYKENKDDNLKRPLDLLKYTETRMIGSGGNVAGASLDLTKTPPELLNHIKKLYTWRKKFEQYFTVYQHILNEPERDQTQIIGEGHILNGSGFILLNNQGDSQLQVNLPLSAPELELDTGKVYRLFDWSNLESGQPMGEASPGEGVVITVPAKTVRIIGINLPTPSPATSGN